MSKGELIDSTWDRTMEVSDYHFDPMRREESFKTVGRVTGTWQKELELLTKFMPTGYDLHSDDDGFKTIKSKKAMGEKVDWGFSDDTIYFFRTRNIPPALMCIAKLLGMENIDVRIHRQMGGNMLHVHVDTFMSLSAREHDPHFNVLGYERFVIALGDWYFGQMWHIGTEPWHQWKAGDIIFSRMRDVPHCTANCGKEPRYTMLVTGKMTDKSWGLVQGPFQKFEVNSESSE